MKVLEPSFNVFMRRVTLRRSAVRAVKRHFKVFLRWFLGILWGIFPGAPIEAEDLLLLVQGVSKDVAEGCALTHQRMQVIVRERI